MKKNIALRILSYVKPYSIYIIGTIISAVVSISFTLLGPILVGRGIDFIVGPGDVNYKGIIETLGILAITIFLSSFFQWIMTLCTNQITYKTVKDIRIQTFNKLNSVPLKYIDTKAHGDIISRIVNDIDIISDGLLQGITQLFTGVATIIGTLIFMLSINYTITIVVVLLTPLSFFVASFIAKRSYHMFREQSMVQGELGGYIEEMIGNQKVVKTFCFEDKAQEKFEEINSRLYKSGVKAQFYSSLTNPSARFINGLVYSAVGIIGAINAINGRLSVGQITSFLTYANQYTKPFNEITGVITQLQSAFSSAERVFKILDEEPEKPDKVDALVLDQCEGKIDMKNVSFSYNPNVKLIQDLDLSVKPGSKIAIVGPTGCGKTTLINLLMRFYDVDTGSIMVDGIDIRDLTRSNLRSMYGMVLQETWLYSATVKENIAYGKPDATDEEIIRAAKLAHAHSFIKNLPQGYDTVISEDGGNISHGQKQLLCIARVMLVQPPMLILDEATSSIDTMTEIRVQKAFNTLMEGRTSFIVAHRLSTIKEADRILVMNNGNIIEQGTHTELLNKGGFYSNLYNSQFAIS